MVPSDWIVSLMNDLFFSALGFLLGVWYWNIRHMSRRSTR